MSSPQDGPTTDPTCPTSKACLGFLTLLVGVGSGCLLSFRSIVLVPMIEKCTTLFLSFPYFFFKGCKGLAWPYSPNTVLLSLFSSPKRGSFVFRPPHIGSILNPLAGPYLRFYYFSDGIPFLIFPNFRPLSSTPSLASSSVSYDKTLTSGVEKFFYVCTYASRSVQFSHEV